MIIQDRDRHLLRELALMRVIDREQAKCAAGFHSTTRANARLLALSRAGLLRRFFLGTLGGARKALYALSENGAKLAGVPFRGPRRRQEHVLVADFSVLHQLCVNEIYCYTKYGAPEAAGVTFVRWAAFHEPITPGIPLIPDGYFEVASDARTLEAFLEVDLGHESRKVWGAKVQAYIRYALSGEFVKQFGHAQFRTLVVVDSERRMQSLRTATAAVTSKVFWFTTFEAIRRDSVWSAIWQRPTGDARLPLITNP